MLARMVPGLGLIAVSFASVTGAGGGAEYGRACSNTYIPTSSWKVWVASHWWGGMECQEHFSWHLWYQLASIDWEIGQNRYIYITGLMCLMCDGGPVECNHPYGWSSVHFSNALYCCMWNSSCQGNRRLCIVVSQKAQQSYRPLATPLAQ